MPNPLTRFSSLCYFEKGADRTSPHHLPAGKHPLIQVITGFNTDVVHNGVTYHVQTEDKGADSPLILSLVYERGTILAAKRSSYEDLVKEGLDEKALGERLKRQHKLICAAIRAGRIEELKRLSAKPATAGTEGDLGSRIPMPEDAPIWDIPLEEIARPAAGDGTAVIDVDDVAIVKEMAQLDPSLDKSLRVKLFGSEKFFAGERKRLNILICRAGAESSVADASVMIKVLGSDFRPLIFHAKADSNGIAVVMVKIPSFRAGRAAILIRAIAGSEEAELRRVIAHDR